MGALAHRLLAAGTLAVLAAGFSAAVVCAATDDTQTTDVRRALTLLNVVGEEYREGVADGAVVRSLEYEESRAFLAEAQDRLRQVDRLETSLGPDFARVQEAVKRKDPPEQVRAQLDRLRARLSELTGVQEEVFPTAPPSAARGRALFTENCVSCHGESADGRGPRAAELKPSPANFSDAQFMRQETPFDFFSVISLGKGGSPMPAWQDVLTLQDRWDLVSFLWTVEPGRDRLAEGQGIYLSQCVGCHGVVGDGHGANSAALLKPVAAMNTPASLARKTNNELFTALSNGIPGTPMPAYAGTLSAEQRWAVVAFLRFQSLGGDLGTSMAAAPEPSAVSPSRFAGLLRLLADEYDKTATADAATKQVEYAESTILLEQVEQQAPAVLAALREHTAAGADEVGAQISELGRAVRGRMPVMPVRMVAHAAATTVQQVLPAEASAPPAPDALAQTRRLLADALAAYGRDDPTTARTLLSDAYFQFEPLERRLAAAAPQITQRVEGNFLELRGVMNAPGAAQRAAAIAATIGRDLDEAQSALVPQGNAYALFFQSATIILREGFEVVLIIGALLAYMVKSGNAQMRRAIIAGTISGIVLSIATAYGIGRLFQGATGVAVEALEGVTLLLATVVLFWVSYWLISKAEADRWQRFIQGKVTAALSRGSGMALAGVALLAVYREGVETTLFYQALLGSAAGHQHEVVTGFLVGLVALGIVYVLFVRLGMRIPMRQFFFATSIFLYYLAFVFAGSGVAELQRAGWIPVTPVAGVPQIDFIGLYPTGESLTAQGILLVCLIYAVAVILRRRWRTSGDLGTVGGAKHAADRVKRIGY